MTSMPVQLVVLAKEPVPGQVKTRLTPPFTSVQAARLAAAALADTLAAAAAVPFTRRVLALGTPAGNVRMPPAPAAGVVGWPGAAGPASPGKTCPPGGFVVSGQCDGGLDERIAAAMSDAHARLPVPVVLIGMDTPQLEPDLLWAAAAPLADGSADAAFGPAADGGFWLLGLRQPDPDLVRGVPMSVDTTGAAVLHRLRRAGLRVSMLPTLTDVDSAADALQVAGQAPGSRFAGLLRTLAPRTSPAPFRGPGPSAEAVTRLRPASAWQAAAIR